MWGGGQRAAAKMPQATFCGRESVRPWALRPFQTIFIHPRSNVPPRGSGRHEGSQGRLLYMLFAVRTVPAQQVFRPLEQNPRACEPMERNRRGVQDHSSPTALPTLSEARR